MLVYDIMDNTKKIMISARIPKALADRVERLGIGLTKTIVYGLEDFCDKTEAQFATVSNYGQNTHAEKDEPLEFEDIFND